MENSNHKVDTQDTLVKPSPRSFVKGAERDSDGYPIHSKDWTDKEIREMPDRFEATVMAE